MKKFLTTILCIVMLATLILPAFAAEVANQEASLLETEDAAALLETNTDAEQETEPTQGEDSPSAELPPLAIVTQPISYKGQVGSYATFFVEANRPDVTYQWMYRQAGKTWKNSTLTGFDADTLSVQMKQFRIGQEYMCVVRDSKGNTVTSEVVTLSEYVVEKELVILEQPLDYHGQVGGTANFTVVADGDGLTYQWFFSQDQGKVWHASTLPGADSASVEVAAKAYRFNCGQLYKCLITDASGNSVETNPVAFWLLGEGGYVLEVIGQPDNYQGAVGSTATFTVTAKGYGLSYQWMYSNNGGLSWSKSTFPGSNDSTVSVPFTARRENQLYKCVITDAYGNTVESSTAVINKLA